MVDSNDSNDGYLIQPPNANYYPKDALTNFWMYAVIAVGTGFVIFVVVALYTVCRGMQEDFKHRVYSTKSSDAGSALLPHTSPGDARRPSYDCRRPSALGVANNGRSGAGDYRPSHRLAPSSVDRRSVTDSRASTCSTTLETEVVMETLTVREGV